MFFISKKDEETIKGFMENKLEEVDLSNPKIISMSLEKARKRKISKTLEKLEKLEPL